MGGYHLFSFFSSLTYHKSAVDVTHSSPLPANLALERPLLRLLIIGSLGRAEMDLPTAVNHIDQVEFSLSNARSLRSIARNNGNKYLMTDKGPRHKDIPIFGVTSTLN